MSVNSSKRVNAGTTVLSSRSTSNIKTNYSLCQNSGEFCYDFTTPPKADLQTYDIPTDANAGSGKRIQQ